MAELIKREVSLTVLKVRLLDARATSAPASGSTPAANQTLTPSQRIFCELQVTGKAEERGFMAPTAEPPDRAPSRSRRKAIPPTQDAEPTDPAILLSRTLAQWSVAPDEMQLPVDYAAALRFRDKPNALMGWVADAARGASKYLGDIRNDTLERFAAGRSWLPSGKPTLPTTMIRQLKMLLVPILREGDSFWLELAEPAGYLPLLPWEEMLRPVTPKPILRLSPHVVQALSPDSELSVVLCLTVPSADWAPSAKQIAALMRAVRQVLPAGSRLHIFADDLCHLLATEALRQIGTGDPGDPAIKVHDLPRSSFDVQARDEAWRAWVAAGLAGSAADILHVVAPARLSADHARLVIANDPQSAVSFEPGEGGRIVVGRPLRYVTPLELTDSLTQLGAWAAVFSSPPRGPALADARLGLRLLADEISRARPGVVAFHDFEADPDGKALAETYAFMIGDPSVKASTSPAVFVYCHPARAAAAPAEPTSVSGDLTEQYLRVKRTVQEAIARSGPTPAWVASTQRIVEQAVSRAVGQEGDDEAVRRGVANALKYVQQILGPSSGVSATSQDVTPPAQTGEATSA